MDAVIQEYKDVFTKYSRNYSDQEMIPQIPNNKKNIIFHQLKAFATENLQKAASEDILKGKKVSPEVQVKITQYIGESMTEESQEALRRIKEHLEKENETLAWRLMRLLRQLLPSNPLHEREPRALDDVRLEGTRLNDIHFTITIFKLLIFLKCVIRFFDLCFCTCRYVCNRLANNQSNLRVGLYQPLDFHPRNKYGNHEVLRSVLIHRES